MHRTLHHSIYALSIASILCGGFCNAQSNEGAKLHRLSKHVEKERPQLDDETRKRIAACRQDPSEANLAALREQIEINYDKVVARKIEKLEELKLTAKHAYKVEEMQVIVDEMIQNRDSRVEQSMNRFTDSRLRPGARQVDDGYLPVIGAGENVSIAYVPVTNEAYSQFLSKTGRKAPKGWANGAIPAGKAQHPVVHVSYDDATAYCKWLSNEDKANIYRLPTKVEWEYAAGHMPKDADFNCGEQDGTSAVTQYSQTLSACGAIDMWGNCWEWTSTPVKSGGKGMMSIKGGSWSSRRTECRTELEGIGRKVKEGYNDVSFRVLRETK